MDEKKQVKNEANREKYKFILKIIFILLIAMAISTAFIYMQYNDIHSVSFMIEQIKFSTFFVFLLLLFPFFGFRKTANWMFKNRWLVIGGVMLFLVLGKYHGDSLCEYDRLIQPNSGNEMVSPLFGVGRAIRSDDWVVITPSIISNEFCENPYSIWNDILQARETNNAVVCANTNSILSIGSNIFTFLFGKIDVEYAFSFYWYAPIFLCFLSTIELGMIITKKNKFVSTLGGVLIAGSSWLLWWKFATAITFAQMAIVMGYYFIYHKKLIYKCLCGIGFSIFFSCFVCFLYPAWQVPIGYIALVFVIWLISSNWNVIKEWRWEWLVLAGAILLSIAFIGYYLYSAKDYISSIMQTIYPGSRRDNGGMIIQRMFYGFMAPLYGMKNVANPTMISIVLTFFPIPLILLLYCLLKKKKKNVLMIGLIGVSVYLILYCTVGLPKVLADVTLISLSTTSKMVEILSVLQVYILMIFLDEIDDMPKFPKQISMVIALAYATISAILCSKQLPGYMTNFYVILMIIIFACVIYSMIAQMQKKYIQVIFGMVMILTIVQAVYIRPVAKGLDAVYSKPLAKEIQHICKEDKGAKWLAVTDNILVSGYMVACGAPTINSVNQYPNMDLWAKLDPTGEYEEVYNRYAHVFLDLTEEKTSFEIVQSDVMQIHLNYDDIKTVGADYIVTLEALEFHEKNGILFEKVYEEDGSYIYRLNYEKTNETVGGEHAKNSNYSSLQ